MSGPALGASRAWDLYFRAQYRLIRLLDPMIRRVLSVMPLGDTEELVVIGRRTGMPRSLLVGLMRIDGNLYVGHPNGPRAQWVRNLQARREVEVRLRGGEHIAAIARRLEPGDERARAIGETWRQHPFPGNVVYWLARRHIRAVGTYFRLDPV